MSLSTARLDGSGLPPWDCARRSAGRNGGCEAAAAIEDESHEAEADELFQRALQLSPVGDLADKIKNQQRRLADRVMRANAQGPRLFRGCAAAYAGAGTASTLRPKPPLDVEAAIGELAVGEALVSFLDDKGAPTPVERALVVPRPCTTTTAKPRTGNRLMNCCVSGPLRPQPPWRLRGGRRRLRSGRLRLRSGRPKRPSRPKPWQSRKPTRAAAPAALVGRRGRQPVRWSHRTQHCPGADGGNPGPAFLS